MKCERLQTLHGTGRTRYPLPGRRLAIAVFLEHAYALVDASVKRYMERVFTNLSVCFGCTGGQHRSVYSAQHLAEHLHKKFGVQVNLIHREQNIEQTFKAKV